MSTISPIEFEEMHGDLPDGAFWALAEENGLYPEDFVEANEAEVANAVQL